MAETRNLDAVLVFLKEGEEDIQRIGLGAHMTREDVDAGVTKVMNQLNFENRGQRAVVHGSAKYVGDAILGVVGVDFYPPLSPADMLRFTQELVGGVPTVSTIDVCEIAESSSKVINRIPLADFYFGEA